MIISFASKETEHIWNGIQIKTMPIAIQNVVRRKLRMLNNSQDIAHLRISPSPPIRRSEKSIGSVTRLYSIQINKRWQIMFQWRKGSASEVAITNRR